MAVSACWGPMAGGSGEHVSRPTTGLTINNRQASPQECTYFFFFFSKQSGSRHSKTCL